MAETPIRMKTLDCVSTPFNQLPNIFVILVVNMVAHKETDQATVADLYSRGGLLSFHGDDNVQDVGEVGDAIGSGSGGFSSNFLGGRISYRCFGVFSRAVVSLWKSRNQGLM
jgi:hypothetical protein